MIFIYYRYEKSPECKIKWAMKAYVQWMNCHNYQVEQGIIPANRCVPDPDKLVLLSAEGICNVLCKFVLEVKISNGEDYNRDTLYDMIVMIQSFLKKNQRYCKIFEDTEFFDLKITLDNRMKDLSKQGKVAPCEKAEPISNDDEELMWKCGILGALQTSC